MAMGWKDVGRAGKEQTKRTCDKSVILYPVLQNTSVGFLLRFYYYCGQKGFQILLQHPVFGEWVRCRTRGSFDLATVLLANGQSSQVGPQRDVVGLLLLSFTAEVILMPQMGLLQQKDRIRIRP